MIDPKNIVRYDYSKVQLEELAVFTICVAGKAASTIAPRVDKLCWQRDRRHGFLCYTTSPFCWLKLLNDLGKLEDRLQELGIGCMKGKARAISELAASGFDLRTCSIADLESINGIGPKTARFFIMSTRKGVKHAALDVHVLRWLDNQGIPGVPKQTPTGNKYAMLEQIFLSMVPVGMTPAEFDLQIWREGSKA